MALNTAYHTTTGTFTPRLARPRKPARAAVLARARNAAASPTAAACTLPSG